MADQIYLYISAAFDLEDERALVNRAVTEIPVGLGWRIVQTPRQSERLDLEAVAAADVHLLLLGSDIRAPVGVEWLAARRSGKLPVLFYNNSIPHTPAAQEFIRTLADSADWRTFKDRADLHHQVLRLLADHIMQQALNYVLRPNELDRLQTWRAGLDKAKSQMVEQLRGGAGDSSVILSPERYVPREGVLIRSPQKPPDPTNSNGRIGEKQW